MAHEVFVSVVRRPQSPVWWRRGVDGDPRPGTLTNCRAAQVARARPDRILLSLHVAHRGLRVRAKARMPEHGLSGGLQNAGGGRVWRHVGGADGGGGLSAPWPRPPLPGHAFLAGARPAVVAGAGDLGFCRGDISCLFACLRVSIEWLVGLWGDWVCDWACVVRIKPTAQPLPPSWVVGKMRDLGFGLPALGGFG